MTKIKISQPKKQQVIVSLPKPKKQNKIQKQWSKLPRVVRRSVRAVGKVSTEGLISGMGSLIVGDGDYHVSGKSDLPSFGRSKHVMNHKDREYLGDVITSGTAGAFSVQQFALNPGLTATFPFLSNIARCYELYEMLGLAFEFRSTSGDSVGSTNAALGTVAISFDYNVLNQAPISKGYMEQMEGAISGKPSENLLFGVECKKSISPLGASYVRTGTNSSTQDLRFSDMGNLYVATQGMQGTSENIGELWVTYNVNLMRKLPSNATGADHFQTTGNVSAHPLGTTAVLVPGSTVGCSIDLVGNNLVLPSDVSEGQFMMVAIGQTSSSVGFIPPTSLVYTNCAVNSAIGNGASFDSVGYVSDQATIAEDFWVITFQITGSGAKINFPTNGTINTQQHGFDFWIIALPATLST